VLQQLLQSIVDTCGLQCPGAQLGCSSARPRRDAGCRGQGPRKTVQRARQGIRIRGRACCRPPKHAAGRAWPWRRPRSKHAQQHVGPAPGEDPWHRSVLLHQHHARARRWPHRIIMHKLMHLGPIPLTFSMHEHVLRNAGRHRWLRATSYMTLLNARGTGSPHKPQVQELMAAAGFKLRPGSTVVGSLMVAAGKAGQGASVQVSPRGLTTREQIRVDRPALLKGARAVDGLGAPARRHVRGGGRVLPPQLSAGWQLRVSNGVGAVPQALWDEALAGNEGRCPNLKLLHAYMHACNLSGQVADLLLLSADKACFD
jgi:hypothetical protein